MWNRNSNSTPSFASFSCRTSLMLRVLLNWYQRMCSEAIAISSRISRRPTPHRREAGRLCSSLVTSKPALPMPTPRCFPSGGPSQNLATKGTQELPGCMETAALHSVGRPSPQSSRATAALLRRLRRMPTLEPSISSFPDLLKTAKGTADQR